MEGWKEFCGPDLFETDVDILRKRAKESFSKYRIYPDSIHFKDGICYFLAWHNGFKVLILYGNDTVVNRFFGSETAIGSGSAKICALSYENCVALREKFPFTLPTNHKGKKITIGLGDRLGLASPAHLHLVKGRDIFPVLAQQSMRELNLTGRTYKDVLSAASWAVFQEGYTKGFGADGDEKHVGRHFKELGI